jgi:transposase
MSRGLFLLRDRQWAAIEPFMPCNKPGSRQKDDRRIVSGIFNVLKSGCRWQDCPEEYGPPATVYSIRQQRPTFRSR